MEARTIIVYIAAFASAIAMAYADPEPEPILGSLGLGGLPVVGGLLG